MARAESDTQDAPEWLELYPECGEDFCSGCGDCLACYGGDPCHAYPDDDTPEEDRAHTASERWIEWKKRKRLADRRLTAEGGEE